MRTPKRLLVIGGALVLALVGTAAPAQASGTVELSQGHVDVFGVAFEDGELHLHVHDDTIEPAEEREPEHVLHVVRPEAEVEVPDNPAFGFLGDPRDPVWILPEIDDPNLLFAGIGTEEIEIGVFEGDSIDLKLLFVLGPADFSLFTVGPTGTPDVLLDSGDGLPDTLTVPAATHLHANWAFGAPGHYFFLVEASGKLADTGETVTDYAIYRFRVDD